MLQAGKIRGVYPMTVSAIVFDTGREEPLRGRSVLICGDFLIVEGEIDGDAPTMYNLKYIRELRDVIEQKPQARAGGW